MRHGNSKWVITLHNGKSPSYVQQQKLKSLPQELKPITKRIITIIVRETIIINPTIKESKH